jgi:glycosyltransferase involved in cell wall biosynthesis
MTNRKNKILVSVIVPTYNRAKILPRSIESVLKQTYKNLEVIIVNDASTDTTEKITKRFIKQDKRIIYKKHIKNRGGAAARNTGIKIAKGKYVAFLDSDDEWMPTKIKKQLDLFSKIPDSFGLVSCYYTIFDHRLKRKRVYKKLGRGDLYSFFLRGFCPSTTSLVLVKKEVFKKIGLFAKNLEN